MSKVLITYYTHTGNTKVMAEIISANHASNPIPLKGRFPHDKPTLLSHIQMMLKNAHLDRSGPGRTPIYL